MVLALHTIALCTFLSVASAACNGTTTIGNQGDATALASCTTFTGDVAIATSTTDDINLGTLKHITGNLSVVNVLLMTSVSGTNLEKIDGTFTLDRVQDLTNLSFPILTDVGNIVWNELPNLEELTFTTGINQVSQVDIQNSELINLDGFNVKVADTVIIAHNRYIAEISIPFINIGSSLTLEMNNPGVNLSFPNLQWASNIMIKNASSLDMPSLNFVNQTLSLHGCDIQSFSVNTLSVVKGVLEIVDNTNLTKVSMPNLLSAGNLTILNNTLIRSIDGFGQLSTVNGTINLTGSFDSVLLPDLKRAGPLSINSTNAGMNCSTFDGYLNNGIIQSYTCNGEAHMANSSLSTASPSISSSVQQPSAPGTESNSPSTGAKAGIGVGAAFGVLALLAAGGFVLFRRRKRAQFPTLHGVDETLKPELDGGDRWREIGGVQCQGELATGKEAVELPAPHNVSELS